LVTSKRAVTCEAAPGLDGNNADAVAGFHEPPHVKGRQHLGQLLGIAQVSRNEAEYEGHVRKIFGQQFEMDV
jgi:hypothetical protein